MWKFCVMILSAISLLSGCGTFGRQSTESKLPPISESKLQPCEKLTKPKSGSHNDVELWAVETVFAYRLCAQKQDDLIDAVRVRQQALEERGK